jgi:protein phosphatase
MQIQVRAVTDIGLRRALNEDCHGQWIPEDPAQGARRGVLLVVADGMGGALAGEVASRMAVDTVIASYRAGEGEPLEDLARAFAAANRSVHVDSNRVEGRAGMGTTLTALVLRPGEAFFAHVGDSRVYLVRAGAALPLTSDHTLVARMVAERQMTPEQARVDPRRNVVTRSVGVAPDVEVDLARTGEAPRAGDTWLLTTDGLHGLVTDAEIGATASGPDLEGACRALVGLARERGGPDNITVVAARIGG